MKKTYKPNKRLGYATEVTYSYQKNESDRLEDFYTELVRNKNKSLSELIEALSKSIYYKTTKSYLEKKIDAIKKTHSVRKAEEARVILNLAVALEENNVEEITRNRLELVRIEQEKEKLKKLSRQNAYGICRKKSKPKDQLISELYEDLDVILEEKKNPDDLYKEGKIQTSQFSKKLTENLDEFEPDTYINYLLSVKEDKPFEEKDLKDMVEVLKYFTTNLALNLNKILSLNPYADEDKVRAFKVEGEKDLKPMFTSSIDKLYDWKVKKISERLQIYLTLLTNANNLLSGNYDNITTLDTKKKRILEDLSPYFYEDFENMVNISKTYDKKIKDSEYKDESKKEELKNKYIKRMVLK